MKIKILSLICGICALLAVTSCSSVKSGSTADHARDRVSTWNVSYNELTMRLDEKGVSYTIDVSTAEGRYKLKDLSLADAQQLALIECIIKNNCATIFNPQFTHLKKGKQILRVTVYGFPARYKNQGE